MDDAVGDVSGAINGQRTLRRSAERHVNSSEIVAVAAEAMKERLDRGIGVNRVARIGFVSDGADGDGISLVLRKEGIECDDDFLVIHAVIARAFEPDAYVIAAGEKIDGPTVEDVNDRDTQSGVVAAEDRDNKRVNLDVKSPRAARISAEVVTDDDIVGRAFVR